MKKKIALITGANTGIGRATAIELAKKNIKVFLACKSFERTKPVIDFINKSHDRVLAEWLELDLSKLRSVKDCADKFLLKNIPLNYLINNAGVAGIRGKTDDGFEAAFGINHLGHFLLTKLLIYKLIQAENSRVVNISSRAHHNVKSINWDNLQKQNACWSETLIF